jgi:ABC-type dipeptide/oligopeptide/nickel transport system ATPase component
MSDGLRDSNLIGIIGNNSSGKSALALLLIQKFNRKRDKLLSEKKYPTNYLKLVVFDPQNRFESEMRAGDLRIRIGDIGWEEKVYKFRDSLFVCDDMKMIVDGDRTKPEFLNIFGWRAEHGLDIILIVWQSNMFPRKISGFIDKYFLMRSNEDDKEYCSRINGNKESIIKAKNIVWNECVKYNKLEYKARYPNFPCVYYDMNEDSFVKVNFKK